jgi:S1-C subfamily serine protease
MKPQKPSIDGFIPRRADSRLGDRHTNRPTVNRRPEAAPTPQGLRPSSASAAGLQQSGQGLTRRDISESLNSIPATTPIPVKKGAYIYNGTDKTAIAANSPAAKAGIKDKDIITKVGDIDVGDRGSVASLVAEYAPGDTIKLTILRGSETVTKEVTLTAFKS